jgi:hypothetical protein
MAGVDVNRTSPARMTAGGSRSGTNLRLELLSTSLRPTLEVVGPAQFVLCSPSGMPAFRAPSTMRCSCALKVGSSLQRSIQP